MVESGSNSPFYILAVNYKFNHLHINNSRLKNWLIKFYKFEKSKEEKYVIQLDQIITG